MVHRYWVIGSDYRDRVPRPLELGLQVVSGPFEVEMMRVRTEWHRPTFRDHCGATTPYSICVEPVWL